MSTLLPAVALLALAAPDKPRDDESPYQVGKIASAKRADTANAAYRLMAPLVDGKPGDRFPLVIYLHGAGAKGDDNAKPMAELLPKLLAEKKLRERFPCYVLVPQCRDGNDSAGRPNNWVKWEGQKDNPPAKWEKAEAEPSDQLAAAALALDEVLKAHPIDPARVYLAGVSMGGSGSCYWAGREPQRFAAVIAACGLSETGKAKELAKVPLWLFHGTDDPVAPFERSKKTADAVKAAGGKVTLTEYSGAGHNIAGKVFSENDYAVLKWLFEQKREAKK